MCLRQTVETSRKTLGEQDPSTLIAIANLAAVLLQQDKLAQAEPLYREALEKKRRVYGEDHPETIYSLNDIGSLLRAQGRLAEAEPYVREVLEKRRRLLGEEHPDTIWTLSDLVAVLQEEGKLAEAESYGREALEKARRVLGEDHPETIRCLNNLGTLFEKKGQFVESERYHRERLEKCRRVLGETNPDTLDAFNKAGRALQRQGKVAESEPVLAEGVGACRRAFPGPDATTALLLHHHADALLAAGRLDDAAVEAREALDMYRDHPDWSANEGLHTVLILKSILTAQKRPDEALAIQREWLSVQRRRLSPTSTDLADLLAYFATDLVTRGTLETVREAEPWVRECLEIRIKAIPDDWRVPNARSLLGAANLRIAELDSGMTPEQRAVRLREAEPLLLDGYQGMLERQATLPSAKVRITQALDRVVRLYEAWDKAEPGKGYDAKSAEWKAKLDAASSAPERK